MIGTLLPARNGVSHHSQPVRRGANRPVLMPVGPVHLALIALDGIMCVSTQFRACRLGQAGIF